MIDIKKFIPHREPFLLIDEIIDHNELKIISMSNFTLEKFPFLVGHFPGNTIVPGVILSEAVFQTGAVLMGIKNQGEEILPMITRIENAKFKNLVRPNDQVIHELEITEVIANAYFIKSNSKVNNKTVLSMTFRCAQA